MKRVLLGERHQDPPHSCGVRAELPSDLAEGQPMVVVEVRDQAELVVDGQKPAAFRTAEWAPFNCFLRPRTSRGRSLQV